MYHANYYHFIIIGGLFVSLEKAVWMNKIFGG